MDVSKSSMSVLGGSRSKLSQFLMRFHDLSQNSICSRLMKLSLPMESLLQMALILFSCMLRAFLRQSRISAKVMTFSLWISKGVLLSPFFLTRRMIFLIWCLLSRGKASCLRTSSAWMNSTSLLSSSTTRHTISSVTPYSIGIPPQRFKPTVEMYFSGSMVDGQMKFRKPTKSTFSLYPQTPNRILTSSSVRTTRFSSRSCRTCLRVMSPSPREMQLKSASGWKSARVVTASRQACSTFSCCSSSARNPQTWSNTSPSFSSARRPTLYRFITDILYNMENEGKRRVVIVNADDYGAEEEIDRGIRELVGERLVNSASVIVNGRNIEKAVQDINKMISKQPNFMLGVSLGLHFNLTEGKPLSSAILSSKLVRSGEFIGKPEIYSISQETDAFNPTHISAELLAQIDKFIQLFGRKPSHIDGHNHVHIIPTLAPAIAQTMAKLGIRKTRIPLQRLESITLNINHKFLSFAAASAPIYSRNGIVWASNFVGLESFGHLSAELLRRALERKEGNGAVEMMCHPGYPAKQGNAWTMSVDRLAEMQQLRSMFQEFRGEGNYHDLGDQTAVPTVLVCYPKPINEEKAGFLEEGVRNFDLSVCYWPKIQLISEQINEIDLDAYAKNFKLTQIIDAHPSPSSNYIQRIALLNGITYTPIHESDSIAQAIQSLRLPPFRQK